jgi:hypothetical protein
MTCMIGSRPVTLVFGPQETPWSPAGCLGCQKKVARSRAFFAVFLSRLRISKCIELEPELSLGSVLDRFGG